MPRRIRSRRIQLVAGVLLAAAVAAQTDPECAASGPLKLRMAFLAGRDSDEIVDSGPKRDFFAQESFSMDYNRLISRRLRGRLSYDAFNVNSFEVTDQNTLIQRAGLGLDTALVPDTTILETEYAYRYAFFPREESLTFDEHQVAAGLSHRCRGAWLRNVYAVSRQAFDSRRPRGADGIWSDEDRRDIEQSVQQEIAFKGIRGTDWKLQHKYLWNDSNDLFQDYYDYQADQYRVGVAFAVAPRIRSILKLAYELRRYEDRPPLEDPGTIQKDRIWMVSLACFYQINKELSLGGIHTYRDKRSNEPTQRHSGSLSTLGLYYSF